MKINADYDGLIDIFQMMRRGAPTVDQLGELSQLLLALEVDGHLEIRDLLEQIRHGVVPGDEHHRKCRKLDSGIVAHQRMGELRRAITDAVASLA